MMYLSIKKKLTKIFHDDESHVYAIVFLPCFTEFGVFLLLDQKATSLADRTILRQITLIKLLGLVEGFFFPAGKPF